MIEATTTGSLTSLEQDEGVERSRFLSILRRYIQARGEDHVNLGRVVNAYLKFSPNSNQLINELISTCVDMKVSGRLDIAIDILSQLGKQICRYANDFLINDITNWGHRFPERAYEPNDDYWFILLRSVAQSSASATDRFGVVRKCGKATSRGVVEAVVESLGDIASEDAMTELKKYLVHEDPFIARLAASILESR